MRALSSLTAVLFLILVVPAGAAVSTGQSGWLWGSPEPQGHNLFALEFQDNTGYAVGDFGTLLRTTDGGSGWGTIRTGTMLDFRDIDVIDGDSIVISSGCAARRTDDGGATFRRLPFTSNERRCSRNIRAVSFPTSDVGYLLLEDGGILRTEDAGRSFAQRSLGPHQGGVMALMFRSATEGLATTSGGEIFKTTDGGDTWTRRFDGDLSLNGVLFTETRAVAVGSAGTFLISGDTGNNWTRPATSPPPNEEFVDVRCADNCLVTAASSKAFVTTNGGQTFANAGVNNAVGLGYASDTRAVVVGFLGETQISDDGGVSFEFVGSRLTDISGLFRIRATSASVAHAAGDRGALVRTIDGGETWQDVGVPSTSTVVDLWFPTAAVGYALDSQGGLVRTENGGTSWSILETGTDETPRGIFAPNADDVFLIGPRGVRRSTDAGETFERHMHRVIRNRTLEEADKAGSAVVFYGPRVIAVSTNGGNTWRSIPRPTQSAEVRDVDFISSKVGYVVETSGRTYFTRNRGQSWTELIGTGYSNIQEIAFGTRSNGWLSLTSSHPTVLRTTDGGKSWKPQDLSPRSVNGLAAFGAGTGFVTISEPTSILFTRRGGDYGDDSRLTLSTPERVLTRRQRIAISGRLTPADGGGEDVEVQARRLSGGAWHEIDVTPNRRGRFTFERRIRRSMVFVAQWEGDADSDGDGTRPLIVRLAR